MSKRMTSWVMVPLMSEGWHLRLLCRTMSKKMISWVVFPSNVGRDDISSCCEEQCWKGWHLRLLCRARSERMTSWVVCQTMFERMTSQVAVPRNVWRDDILGCCVEKCQKGWHLGLWCQAIPLRFDISGHCAEQYRWGYGTLFSRQDPFKRDSI